MVRLIAFGFGLGCLPVAPGTFGSLLGIPVYVLLVLPFAGSMPATLAVAAGLVAAACWIAGRADRDLGQHDSARIVVDEIAGMAIALIGFAPTLLDVAVLFLLFRAFDIVKLWPAGQIDRRVPGGVGVVLDDVVSGLYANLAGRLLL